MGGGSYDRDVGSSGSSYGFDSGKTSTPAAKKAMGKSSMDKDTSPYQRKIVSNTESPIVIVEDVTGSNKEFSAIFYDKAPMFHGQIEQKKYLTDFDISFSAVGDATSDRAPLQVNDFDKGTALDDKLKKIYLEGNGGGQTRESYELAAYYFANYCDMPKAKNPFIFFIGDESPYTILAPEILEEIVGEKIQGPIPTEKIFKDLFKKFNGNVYFIQNNYCGETSNASITDNIRKTWITAFGPGYAQHVIKIPSGEEKSIVDIMLGIIATANKVRSLEQYQSDMADRDQTDARIDAVGEALKDHYASIVGSEATKAVKALKTTAKPRTKRR
jgi:hypothetical protein